jgi:hypothetical protein
MFGKKSYSKTATYIFTLLPTDLLRLNVCVVRGIAFATKAKLKALPRLLIMWIDTALKC